MLEFDVLPEHGLMCDDLEFVLGMHLGQVVAAIQQHVGEIKDVQVIYNDSDPLAADIVICLTKDGIRLVFDSLYQRLKLIEIYDLSLVRLKYCDTLFNCPEVTPTIDQIDQCFGATHPGSYDAKLKIFTLKFRGLAFEFPSDENLQTQIGCETLDSAFGRLHMSGDGSATGTSSSSADATPSRSRKASSRQPRVARILIFHATAAPASIADGPATVSNADSLRRPLTRSDLLTPYDEGVVEIITADRPSLTATGIRLHRWVDALSAPGGDTLTPPPPPVHDTVTTDAGNKQRTCSDDGGNDARATLSLAAAAAAGGELCTQVVKFGDTVQCVMSAIGAPADVFYKSEDKMKIHSSNAERLLAETKSDYFFNYFHFGFDILFDATSHTVKKIILHTNYPGHYNFNMYRRCQFTLMLPKLTSTSAVKSNNKRNARIATAHTAATSPLVEVNAFSKWVDIASHVVGRCAVAGDACAACARAQRPVVVNRASSTNTMNPFGPTFCYGYRPCPVAECSGGQEQQQLLQQRNFGAQNVIFEVMRNGHLASVVLFAAKHSLPLVKNGGDDGSGRSNSTPAGSRYYMADGQLVRC